MTRYLTDYMSLTARIAFPAAVALTGAAAAVNALDRHATQPIASGSLVRPVVVVCVSAVLTQMVVRIIVSRPQPAVSAALVATDDALRAEAVQRLAGAGLLASFLATLAALWVASFAATNLWIRAGGVTLMILTLVLPIASAVATRRSAARPTRLPVVRH